MKRKMHYQVQPREVAGPRPVQARNEQARNEIENFLEALDSYPARAAKEPSVSFRQHLSSLLAGDRDDLRDPRHDNRPRRQ